MPLITMELPEFINLSRAAKLLGVSRPTLYKRMAARCVRPTKIGHEQFLTPGDIGILRQPKV